MSDNERECIHCGHKEGDHFDLGEGPSCRLCMKMGVKDGRFTDLAGHSFHPIQNTERGAMFEELDPSSGRYHGHTGGGAGYAGKQWVHQHDGGNMPHEHFRQGVHTNQYHATGYQENVPDKLPPDIRDKDISKSQGYVLGRGGEGKGAEHRHPLRWGKEIIGHVVHSHVGDNVARGHGHEGYAARLEPGQITGFEPLAKSIMGHTHEDDDFEDHRSGEMHFTGYHEHEMTEADGHTHGADDATRLPNGHRIYCAQMGHGPDTDRDNRCNCDATPAICGRSDPHRAHPTGGGKFCNGNLGEPIAGRPAEASASAVPDRVPKTWARIKPKKEYPPEITARARYVPGKREAEVGKRVDTILALRHKFHGTATDRMGKSAADGDCVTCGHQSAYHSTESDGACKLCACDAYKRERTCVDCQHGESEHHTARAYDSQGTIETGCNHCKCIKYREPSVGRWAKPRDRKIPADHRIDTALALRAKWHGTGQSILDKSHRPLSTRNLFRHVRAPGKKVKRHLAKEHADTGPYTKVSWDGGPEAEDHGLHHGMRHGEMQRVNKAMPEGEAHTEFPESGADLYNHMLTGHGRGTKTGWKLFSGSVDLEHPRVRAQLHKLHLAEHQPKTGPEHSHGDKGLPSGGAYHTHAKDGNLEHMDPQGDQYEHRHPDAKRPFVAKAAQRLTLSKSERPKVAGFLICDCGHAIESHHYPLEHAKTGANFCNRADCGCKGYTVTDLNDPRETPDRLPSDIRDMKIDKSHDGGPGPAWDIHTTNEWHSPDCALTEGKRGGIKFHVERWRRNGATKTWKTRPGEFRIPVKHGMKNYDYIDHTNHKFYHPADRCPEDQNFETKLQVRATDRLPADIANMKLDKSSGANCKYRCKCGGHALRDEYGDIRCNREGGHGVVPPGCTCGFKKIADHVKTGGEHCEKCGHIFDHSKDPIKGTYCASCPDCIDRPHARQDRVNVPDKLPDDIRDRDVNKSRRLNSKAVFTLSGPRYCRECRADLTGMKAIDIGRHMGGHPEGSRAVITGLRAGYGGLPERAMQEPANGARHRSTSCAFGYHEGCDKVVQTHPKNPAAKAGRKLTCDCRCHPSDRLPDDIRDMDIEKSMHSAGCRSRLVSPCADEKHGGVDNHCWTAHPLPGGGPCDCGGIKRAADRARAELGLQLPEHLSPTGRTPNQLPASIRNMKIEKGRVQIVSPKSYGPVGAWCKAPAIPDTCHNLGHGIARARASGWAEDDEGWRYGLCSRHVKKPDDYHSTMKITGPREKVDVPDQLPKDFGKSIWRLHKGGDYCGADSDESPEVFEEKLSHEPNETRTPKNFASTCKQRGSYSGLLSPTGKVYARPGYQQHEDMTAGLQHDEHSLVNNHGWARLSAQGRHMNIDINHDTMSRDTAANVHQIATTHGQVDGWTCYGRHRGGWEYGRDGASLAEHLEEEASKKSLAKGQP